MMIIEPQGGLGNRLRVIASALRISSMNKNKLFLIWNQNSELNCAFYDLFEKSTEITVIDKPKFINHIRSNNQKWTLKKLIAKINNSFYGIDLCFTDSLLIDYLNSKKIDIDYFLQSYSNIYLKGCLEFGNPIQYYNLLKPTKEIQNKINLQLEHFDSLTIGIHIRRNDNEASIKNSPTLLFCKVIEENINANNNHKFFLSTDDPKVERFLQSRFDNNLISQNKNYYRNCPEGIKDALVDLICLSNTCRIYGSYWSSFSQVASKIGKKELIVVKN